MDGALFETGILILRQEAAQLFAATHHTTSSSSKMTMAVTPLPAGQ